MLLIKFKSRTLVQLRCDTAGLVISSELILLATVAVVGLVVGSSALRDAVISELSDIGGAVQDLQGSYAVRGLTGHSSKVAGSSFGDSTDHCDSPEDPFGAADNCIVFDEPPSDEAEGGAPLLSTEEQVVKLNFDDGDAADSSPFGGDNSAIEVGDPSFVDGALELDGDDALIISNTADINLGIHTERLITLTFNADDVTSTQVLYEEGAGVRGLVIYIENGLLYVGGWNIPDGESGWDPVFVSTPISAGVDNTVTLALNGDGTVQPGALSGFLNGNLFGSAAGSQLWQHGGGIGIGGTNGVTILESGVSNADNFFTGTIDNVCIHNRTLADDEVLSGD